MSYKDCGGLSRREIVELGAFELFLSLNFWLKTQIEANFFGISIGWYWCQYRVDNSSSSNIVFENYLRSFKLSNSYQQELRHLMSTENMVFEFDFALWFVPYISYINSFLENFVGASLHELESHFPCYLVFYPASFTTYPRIVRSWRCVCSEVRMING